MAAKLKVGKTEILSTTGVGADVTVGSVIASSIVSATNADPESVGTLILWGLSTILSHFVRKWLFTES